MTPVLSRPIARAPPTAHAYQGTPSPPLSLLSALAVGVASAVRVGAGPIAVGVGDCSGAGVSRPGVGVTNGVDSTGVVGSGLGRSLTVRIRVSPALNGPDGVSCAATTAYWPGPASGDNWAEKVPSSPTAISRAATEPSIVIVTAEQPGSAQKPVPDAVIVEPAGALAGWRNSLGSAAYVIANVNARQARLRAAAIQDFERRAVIAFPQYMTARDLG